MRLHPLLVQKIPAMLDKLALSAVKSGGSAIKPHEIAPLLGVQEELRAEKSLPPRDIAVPSVKGPCADALRNHVLGIVGARAAAKALSAQLCRDDDASGLPEAPPTTTDVITDDDDLLSQTVARLYQDVKACGEIPANQLSTVKLSQYYGACKTFLRIARDRGALVEGALTLTQEIALRCLQCMELGGTSERLHLLLDHLLESKPLDDDASEVIVDDREACKDFFTFVKRAWPYLDVSQAKLKTAAHHPIVCQHMEALYDGRLPRQVINLPPSATKTTICSIAWTAWIWGPKGDPNFATLLASCTYDLSVKNARALRRLVESSFFRERWNIGPLKGAENDFWTEQGGNVFAVGQNSNILSRHFSAAVIDDPHSANDSPAVMDRTAEWVQGLLTRHRDPETFRVCCVAQRLRDNDLSAWLKDQGYACLSFSAIYDPAIAIPHPLGTKDMRNPGELLWPEHITQAVLDDKKRNMPDLFDAMYLQDPIAPGSGIVSEEHFQPFDVLPPFPVFYISVDLAFKGTERSDNCAFVCAAYVHPNFYITDVIARREDFPASVVTMRGLLAKFPTATVLVEDKANGSALVSTLSKDIPGIVPVQVAGDKMQRFQAAARYFHGRNVFVQKGAPWLPEYMKELTRFPKAKLMDRVDATSQLFLWVADHQGINMCKPGQWPAFGGLQGDFGPGGMRRFTA